MDRARRIAITGLEVSIGVAVVGYAVAAGAAAVAGGSFLGPAPWMDIGVGLALAGLAGALALAVLRLIIEPLALRRRAMGFLGAAAAGFLWFVLSVFGLGGAGACCGTGRSSIVTIFYSAPEWLLWLTLFTGVAVVSAGRAFGRPARDPFGT